MKSLIFSGVLLIFFLASSPITAQNFPKPDSSPMDLAMYRGEDKAPRVKVIYSRPQVRDRQIFGKMQKYGEVWRTGANESTEITFYKDMMLGDKRVKAGTYTLFTIPGENEWTVILNKNLDTWGAYGYKEERDLLRIKTPARKSNKNIEYFSIFFQPRTEGADMLLGWENTYIQVPIGEVE